MSSGEWVYGPFGLNAGRGHTCETQRTVLVVVHHLTAATRLADIVPVLESDRRVQVVFTRAPASIPTDGTRHLLERLDALVVPWEQATHTRFDLAVAASHGLLERLHAPVLTVPHGIGFGKYARQWAGPGPTAGREPYGMERAVLVYRGRVIPSSIVVPTRRHLARLNSSCPEATPVTIVGGDPCYDRLAESVPTRDAYRAALGVQRRRLIAVSSTWGSGSLLEQCPDLLPSLMQELPHDEYLVAAIVHPGVWSWYGRRQVRAWYADCMCRGMVLMPPEEGWRAVLAAADVVIGDHGSVTYYGAAIGAPVLLASFPHGELDPESAVADLGRIAPRLRLDRPVVPQLAAAGEAWSPGSHATIRARVTDLPGRSAQAIRTEMYRLMNLPEPGTPPEVRPVPIPSPVSIPETFGVSR